MQRREFFTAKLPDATRELAGLPVGTDGRYYVGGEGSSGYKHTDESKLKMSESKKETQIGENNSFYGKKHSNKTLKQMSEVKKEMYLGDKNPFFGKVHSEETINYLKEINTGSNHPKAHLTEKDVLEIRAKYPDARGKHRAVKKLAEEYHITTDYIRCIIKRMTWKHI